MLPYERSLVTRMKDQPFVLVGINCDQDTNVLQQVGFSEQLTWRNLWNGGSKGPWTDLYGVDHWPATIVLDAKGVIRYRDLRGPELEQAIATLLRETEQQHGS
jgi:hypothetical protein